MTETKSNNNNNNKNPKTTKTTSSRNNHRMSASVRLMTVLREIANSPQHQERLRVGKFTKWAARRSASQLYRTIQLVDQIGRRLNPHSLTAQNAMTVSEVLRVAEMGCYSSKRPLNMESELLPWASVLTVSDVMGVLWLIGMISIENNATVMSWSPKHSSQSSSSLSSSSSSSSLSSWHALIPAHDGASKLVRLVHGLPVSYQRGGREISFSSPPNVS